MSLLDNSVDNWNIVKNKSKYLLQAYIDYNKIETQWLRSCTVNQVLSVVYYLHILLMCTQHFYVLVLWKIEIAFLLCFISKPQCRCFIEKCFSYRSFFCFALLLHFSSKCPSIRLPMTFNSGTTSSIGKVSAKRI